jgi:pyroglutamyl-peptidase
MTGADVILVTGFEPFAGDALNPSQELAKALDGRPAGTAIVRGLVLPVQHEAAREIVLAALEESTPRAVVHFGLAGGRARIALERVAVNVMDYALPDARGDLVRDEPCVPGGPQAYFATLPLRTLLSELTADGIPAYLSYTAGTYLCNHILYSTLHAIAARGLPTRAGFVHLPFLPAMVAAHGLDEASMDLGVLVRAAECILGVIGSP